MKFSKSLSLICILLLVATSIFAGQTGKIAGVISDSESDEGLIGVNVVVEELGVGAASGVDGEYFILNIPPGRYTLRFMMIGYTTVVVEQVVVAMEQTTTINQTMSSEVLGMEEVQVTATRPTVVKDLSASQLYVGEETIKDLPLASISSVVGLQAGVSGVSVRGGSTAQTAFIVDGFQLSDGRSNSPTIALSLNSVEEIQVQSGGFNAEYGNIRSGIINVVTAEGGHNKYKGSLTYYHTPAAPKNYGISPYAKDSYYLRPYLDDAVAWLGTDGEDFTDVNNNFEWDIGEPFVDYNGDGEWTGWDPYTKEQNISFEGWNARSLVTLNDGDPSNDLTPSEAQREFLWKHRRVGFIEEPDHVLDFGFGGPVPGLYGFGNLRFYLSHQNSYSAFVVPLSRDGYSSSTTRLKLNADISAQTKLTMTGQVSTDESASPYNWTTTPTGSVLSSTWSVANLVSGGSNVLFMPGYFSPSDIYRSNVGLKVNHMFSNSQFIEVIYQYLHSKYWTYETDARSDELFEISPGVWRDEAPYGYNGGEWMNIGRDSSVIQTHTLKADYTNQINNRNQLKAGLLFKYTDLAIRSFADSDKDTWRRTQIYDRPPYSLSLYVQDKLEYEGFIANIGLRAEYNDPNAPVYLLDPYDGTYAQGFGADIEETAPQEDAEAFWTISPRLGISHPITDQSKLYFNYGHFHSEPASTYRFRLQRESNGQVTSIGNPSLELEQTIAYELGYSQSLFTDYLLNIATYYKDVTNQPNWVRYTNVNRSVNYITPMSNNYEDIRGIEFTVQKMNGRWLTGFLNFTYMVRSTGFFDLTQYYQDPKEQREFEKINLVDSETTPQPYSRANLVFHVPKNFGPSVAGVSLLGNWNLSLLARYTMGAKQTWIQGDKKFERRGMDTYNIDTRLTRTFDSNMGDLEFFMEVNNLLDTKWLSSTGFAGSRDQTAYSNSLHYPWEEGLQNGEDRWGEYRDWDTEFRPMYATDSLSSVQVTPQSHEIYYEESSGSYWKWDDAADGWDQVSESTIDQLIEDKAYIDMPNIRSMTFLSPRQITFGIRIKF
ncbi:MAG: TonB-dependent receptor [Candidatus Marinimicrobia bacterium]|nr:TonB-dependent receptor [Candidatus Neomarinimicrobiota bacterium]